MKHFLLVFGLSLSFAGVVRAQETTPEPEASIFFDDFNYGATDDAAFTEQGWIVRTAEGWPGVPGAIWSVDSVTIVDDPDQVDNRLVQMTAWADGDTTNQAQLCQQRKFFEGTYASRVHFTDEPAIGPDGDNMVETFYMISPLAFDLDPDYSELDFEYLPNGGWGGARNILFATTWETFRPEPRWLADNTSGSMELSFEGWHTLVLQVAEGEVTYYVDGHLIDIHDGDYYPEVPMSLNYNLWFINGGQIDSREERRYVEQIDWAFHAADTVLSPEEVDTMIEGLRGEGVAHVDTVPALDPFLESPCNF